jgi:hypothetical protein
MSHSFAYPANAAHALSAPLPAPPKHRAQFCLLLGNETGFKTLYLLSPYPFDGVIRIEGKMLHLDRGARPGPGRFRASIMKHSEV